MSWSAVDALDGRLDSVLGRWRGNPVADALAYGASALGDHGLVWFLIGVARSRRPGPGRNRAVWAVAFSGMITPVVNEAVKRSVGRRRPAPAHDDPRPVRVPRSTSFPSGHALAAWCAATLLATDDPLGPALLRGGRPSSRSAGSISASTTPPTSWPGRPWGSLWGSSDGRLEPAGGRPGRGQEWGPVRRGLETS